jgi:uncharacterized protein YaeQ
MFAHGYANQYIPNGYTKNTHTTINAWWALNAPPSYPIMHNATHAMQNATHAMHNALPMPQPSTNLILTYATITTL